jgi:hypothetical protein
MKKQLPALIAAFLMTGFITLVMVVTSANALLNQNAVDPSSSASTVSAASASTTSLDQAQIQQLQDRIKEYTQREQQYQQRELQYQQELQASQTKLSEATVQVQQFQQFLLALQERGLIRIQENGSVLITSSPNR